MVKTAVHISMEMLEWLINKAETIGSPETATGLLLAWKSGAKTPTFNQVEKMSKQLSIPLGFFFLDKPPKEECHIVDYRTINSVALIEPSRNLIDTLDMMDDVQSWMVDYVTSVGQEELSFVGKADINQNPKEVADDIRKTLGLKIDWNTRYSKPREVFNYVKKLLSQNGILVMMSGIVGNNTRRKLSIEEFRAFTLVDKYVPLIFINSCDSDAGKLFSILHETAHIWIGKNSFYNNQMWETGEASTEKICNAIAAEILVPDELFTHVWNKGDTDIVHEISDVAKRFNCSPYVVARKALDKRFIHTKEYKSIINELNGLFFEWKEKQRASESSGGDYYRNLSSRIDHRFVMALANSAKEGRTQYSEVYRLTNTNRSTFDKLLIELGGVG